MRVLITGGFGYLGGRLASFFAGRGYEIVLASRQLKSIPSWLPNSTVRSIDWHCENSLRDACLGVDVVIHAAGVNARDCELDPVAALEFNGLATAKLVSASIDIGVSQFYYLSSVHVYSFSFKGEITENTCPNNLHPYATSQLAGEKALLDAICRTKELSGGVLRLSNCIGSPMHKNSNCWMLVVNDLCRQVIEYNKMVVKSPKYISRDFFPISLLCRAIETMVEKQSLQSPILNVSSNQCRTLKNIADLISDRAFVNFNFKPEILYLNEIGNEMTNPFSISNDLLKKYINTNVGLDDEIDLLLNNCRAWFSKKRA